MNIIGTARESGKENERTVNSYDVVYYSQWRDLTNQRKQESRIQIQT